MPPPTNETIAVAVKFLKFIGGRNRYRDMVSVSDVDAPDSAALKALEFLHSEQFVTGRSYRDKGDTDGLVAITKVQMTQLGKAWLHEQEQGTSPGASSHDLHPALVNAPAAALDAADAYREGLIRLRRTPVNDPMYPYFAKQARELMGALKKSGVNPYALLHDRRWQGDQ